MLADCGGCWETVGDAGRLGLMYLGGVMMDDTWFGPCDEDYSTPR